MELILALDCFLKYLFLNLDARLVVMYVEKIDSSLLDTSVAGSEQDAYRVWHPGKFMIMRCFRILISCPGVLRCGLTRVRCKSMERFGHQNDRFFISSFVEPSSCCIL